MFEVQPTPEALAAQRRATELADEILGPQAATLDLEGGFPRASLAKLAAAGLLGVNVPRHLGGLEAGAVAYSLVVTELAKACASTTVALCVSNMVAEVITKVGSEAQKTAFVPKLCDGSLVVGAFALSEPGAGSDPAAMRTTAERTAAGWVIRGRKLWITSGSDAGLFVVWARTGAADSGTRGISAFVVPGDAPGLLRGRAEHKLGLRGSTTVALDFEDCEVPADALLQGEGRGFPIAMMALDGGRIGIASQALGIGLAANENLRQAMIAKTVASVQHAQFALADNATELEAARLLTLRAAAHKQDGKPFSHVASMAKLMASEAAWKACNRALDVLGEPAHVASHPLQRWYRDVRVTQIYEGTSEIQRLVIAREIARRFAQEMR